MSQYKVPQDVEADDKLLGPFSFRQLIYLFVAAGLCALAYLFFTIFPILVIIPVPLILLFATLALPLRKDQPMETYLAALVTFYLKPRKRFWNPGQQDSTILITAPKIIEESRTRDISGDEAGHRLSFLANIVDTEGHAIRDTSSIHEDIVAEANATPDIFDTASPNLDRLITDDSNARHTAAVDEMKQAIKKEENETSTASTSGMPVVQPLHHADTTVQAQTRQTTTDNTPAPSKGPAPAPQPTPPPNPKLASLADADELSVATIAKQANHIAKSHIDETDETFISLH